MPRPFPAPCGSRFLPPLAALALLASVGLPQSARASCPSSVTILDTLNCSSDISDQVTGSDPSLLGGSSYPYTCGTPYAPLYQQAGEDVYEFVATHSGSVTLEVTGMDCDLDIYVLDSSCDSQTGCLSGSTAAGSADDSVSFPATAGSTYYIIIEAYGYTVGSYYSGYCGSGDGHYTLSFDVSAGTGCPEDCDNGLDDDLDTDVDCDDSDCVGDPVCCDADNDGYDEDSSDCRGTDCDDTDVTIYPGAPETPYDGIDQDCDGLDLVDVDGDGYSSTIVGGSDCDDSDASIYVGAIEDADGADDDCDGTVDETTEWYDDDGDGWAESGGDCDDEVSALHPGAEETCDGTDEDCDGIVDEGTDCYDDDGDGYSENDGDCNDEDPYVSPDATELGNYYDDDCDGDVDEGTERFDDDGDGYSEVGGDCDDAEATTHPGASEADDGIDNDCDDEVDEDFGDDLDGDGFTADADCDDDNGWVNPDRIEMCDGIDNDCDGEVDETCEEVTDFEDPAECTCAAGLSAGSAGLLGALAGLWFSARRRRRRDHTLGGAA